MSSDDLILAAWFDTRDDAAMWQAPVGTRLRARIIALRAADEALEAGDEELLRQIMAFYDAVLEPPQPRDERGRFMWAPSTVHH
ncbi:MAG: hypothetical protein ABW063_09135 [Caulobacter sp.]